ncbi:TIGR01459 family HAD-type hydrolase [Amphiplicatus metriothermophilus]|uniref:HAD-superfamily class IIA hydrolase, TIGR01459 n=1 Tax=Amphiplicatus metriothermophilus TaxID=1519374 RepID=A0A239PLU7_9PROT|nr:TIGR01459 family HAD-type hydrolase [Amphiplicatus metriothermophilus]MBB5517341.1 HAD superfamily hydrolase (TIGR01459 family) [Amphiplicatus metriothermophilus]SNT68323.1 HAD-superfamily class IIA hydrolase, TIGR01459 [Amphiplicatus metriothermophilus]
MTEPVFIERLSAIAGRYDALLCDAWGVIHNGVALFDGAAEALAAFRRARGPVVILTNAPRPSSAIPPQLDRLGLPRAAYDAVVTSGDATRAQIAARLPAPAYRIGPEKDDPLFDGLDIRFAPLDEAAFVICTGLRDEMREEPEDYRALLEAAAARRLPMICANPDVVVRLGDRLIWCAGALARIYEELGGVVEYGGKPHPPIYGLALGEAEAARGRPLVRARALAVGDGLHTDIAGANAQGMDAVYVVGPGGVHDGGADAGDVSAILSKAGARALAVMERLQW